MSVEEAGLAPEPDIVSAHPVARPLRLSALPAGLRWDGPFRRLTGVAALMVVAALAAMLVDDAPRMLHAWEGIAPPVGILLHGEAPAESRPRPCAASE